MRTPGGSPRSPTSLRRGTQQSPPKLDDFLGRITKKVAAVSLDFAQYGGHRGSEWAWGVSCVLMWSPTLAHILCAAAGTTWLLQLIGDMQQSRSFHDTCKRELPRGQAANIPEVNLCHLL